VATIRNAECEYTIPGETTKVLIILKLKNSIQFQVDTKFQIINNKLQYKSFNPAADNPEILTVQHLRKAVARKGIYDV
jgi:hypothetical protein